MVNPHVAARMEAARKEAADKKARDAAQQAGQKDTQKEEQKQNPNPPSPLAQREQRIEPRKVIERIEANPKSKRYFARVAHSRFVFHDGTDVVFAFGHADISNPVHQAELDAICPPLGNNPNIFTQESIKALETLPQVSQNAKSEVEIATADAALRGSKTKISQETGPVILSGPSSVDSSTLDPELLHAATNANATPIGSSVIVPVDVNTIQGGARQSTS